MWLSIHPSFQSSERQFISEAQFSGGSKKSLRVFSLFSFSLFIGCYCCKSGRDHSQALYMEELKLEARGSFRGLERMSLFGTCSFLTDRRDKLRKEGANTFSSAAEHPILGRADSIYSTCPEDPEPKGRIPQFPAESSVRFSHQSEVTQPAGNKAGFHSRLRCQGPSLEAKPQDPLSVLSLAETQLHA